VDIEATARLREQGPAVGRAQARDLPTGDPEAVRSGVPLLRARPLCATSWATRREPASTS
jgi:hypothetical protein